MTKKTNQFAEPIEETEEIAVPVPEKGSDLKQARIKGTWNMYWGGKVYNFVDGKTFNIPQELFNHLKNYGNIYDTL
jgi:hypothetical protein